MNVYEKYRAYFIEDPVRACALRAFSAVAEGRIGRMTFLMATDEQMREILDDEDYAFWIKQKARHRKKSEQSN